MQDGIYQITFTTSTGTLGEGVCLFTGGRYVGADFIHSYHGAIAQVGSDVTATMHCRRQPEATSRMPLPEVFDVEWKGEESFQGFVLETELPGDIGVLRCTGRRLQTSG